MTQQIDEMLGHYLREIEHYPLLSPEQESMLSQRVAQNDKEARQRFIETNLRLVVAIAKKYRGRGIDLMDLIQEGNVALIQAIDHFDPERGFRFSSYGTRWVEESLIHLLSSQMRSDELTEELEEALEDPHARDQLTALEEEDEQSALLLAAFATINDRERTVIVLRYGLDGKKSPRPYAEVACILGLSAPRVRQIEINALHRLKGASAALKDYWNEQSA